MESFLSRAQKLTTYSAILLFGIGLGVFAVSANHFNDAYGLACTAGAFFCAGGSYAYKTVRDKLNQETV